LHGLGPVLPALELGLVLAPLSLHVAFGLRTLGREKLKFAVEKHHHGSDVRYWLQRVTAVILLLFLVFHLATMHRWLGGRFDPHNAFASASQAVWRFWPRLAAAHPANFLTAELYLLGIAAAVYHLANGVATGADILGLAPTMQQRRRLWHFCIISGAALGAIGMAAWYAFRDEAIFLQARKPASASLLNEDFTPVNSFHLNSRPQTSLDHHVSI
jgi:succinate dehydrogenase / fumarate reductase cytochrome b subunit